MPTPESAAFLAKKPKVPPTFEGVNFLDNQAVYDARDAIIREQWIQLMMARLVREELGKCYVREGVNHLANCGRYRERYLQLLKENKEFGYRGQQQNYIPTANAQDEMLTNFPTVQQAMGSAGTDRRKGLTKGYGPGGAGDAFKGFSTTEGPDGKTDQEGVYRLTIRKP